MLRKLMIAGLVAALSIFAAVPALAQVPAPGGPFSSTLAIQNVSGVSANCSYTFYNAAGGAAFTSGAAAIASFDSLIVFVNTIGGLAAGSYSSVVSCDQSVAAMSLYKDADSEASYRAVAAPSSVYYAPGIYDNYYGYFTNIVAQNTTAGLVDITVDIFAPGSAVPALTQNANDVPSLASANFEQDNQAALSNNVTYSAKISAFVANTATPANIAPVVNIYGSGGIAPQTLSYNPFASGGTTWYTPVNMVHYFGWNSALVIQNIGSVATSVTVTYSNGENQTNPNLAANSAWSIYLPVAPGLGGSPLFDNPGNVLVGATIVSTSQPIVVMVNESNNMQRAATYTGLSGGDDELYSPLVAKNSGPNRSSLTCQNVGVAANTVTATFIKAGAGASDVVVVSGAIAPGASQSWYLPAIAAITNGWAGSARVTSAGTFGCIVNYGDDITVTQKDLLSAYESMSAP